jgi:integrase
VEITGPFLDRLKKRRRQPACWFLRYTAPKLNADGTSVLDTEGRPILQRHRPYYETKALAEADKPRILEQHSTTGSGSFLFDRQAAADYESAKKILGDVRLVDVAKFWRLHHPEKPKEKLEELVPKFLKDVEERLGMGRHYSDLKSRVGQFTAAGFSKRYPETVTRQEILDYVRNIPDAEPRTKRNHKTAVCVFFNWLVDRQLVTANPAAGIKKRMLPREVKKEIEFLSLERVTRYLRAAERYDPELVAHEVVQLIAGVRADDEMADFSAEFVHPQTKEVVIPAAVAKTEAREVIDGLEENFWAWWKQYAPEKGLLRPKNHGPRWDRIRVLAAMNDREEADRLARLPIKHLLRLPTVGELRRREPWPWNARRRTFCTYHIAKHQSAAKTALIMRHRGSSYTLHNSYRGLGVTQEQGVAYFEIMPEPVTHPIRPEIVLRGAALARSQPVATATGS